MEKETLKAEIKRLAKEKNAVIMVHDYQQDDIQDVADVIGDSMALAQKAADTQADIIILCGVHFMGETAKIICPDKKVLVPDMNAGCSLADSCPADEFERFVKEHPDHMVVSYVNTSASVKALTDVVVTSSNARKIIEMIPEDIDNDKSCGIGAQINDPYALRRLLQPGSCFIHIHSRPFA